MPSCFVCGRTRNKNSTIEDITFHKFPVNEKVRDKWKNFVLENKLNIHSINKYSVVCSKHFLETCFVMWNNKRFLVGNAVPSKIILRVKSARNLYSEEVKLLNQPIVCSDNEPKSSFKVTQTLIKETEGAHLANKLRKQHIHYHKQKMKVKLATQLISQSVADALKFLKNNLCLPDFLQAGATIKFIEMFNAGFDILNSRSANCIGKKKLCVKKTIKKY
ncbi:THAP domain-containing protein 2-like [Acyrthosiphon pisum]|uniref:THAP-type domain-containing protein n=1 Tax=Acyrthosiphon pisum TaxID=7029 RepID=A0A8R2NKK5_ACYPI|nr:THAP domain-containing protein 2-like [Acyrthosiphon pisum]